MDALYVSLASSRLHFNTSKAQFTQFIWLGGGDDLICN